MQLPRRQFLHLGAAALPVMSGVARAQPYPERSVRIVLGFAAGGALDIQARRIGHWLSHRLGQSFVIENRPGAGGNFAPEVVAHAPADGYTLLVIPTTYAINATLYDRLNYDLGRDIAPVAGISHMPLVLMVNPSVPVKTVPEFIAYAKANPGKLNFASAGNATPQHISAELFKMMTGVNMLHVPYRGDAPALIDLLSGQVQVMFDSPPASLQHIRAGKLRPLAVTTATRSEALPEIPILRDFVPGYESSAWVGVGVPKSTPAGIIEKLNREINAALTDPEVRAQIADESATPLPGSPADFERHLARETEKWRKVIRFAGIKLD